jgi:hypothetical protein
MLAAFAALIPPVLYAGFRYKTLLHASLLLAALLVEVVGHVGKIFLVANPTSHAYSAVYLLGTHWGAVLVGSAMNLVLPHVLVIYGQEFRLVSDPVYLSTLFLILDIFMLAFQSVGIGFAATANTALEVWSVPGNPVCLRALTISVGFSGGQHPPYRPCLPSHQPAHLLGYISLLPVQTCTSPLYPRRHILGCLSFPEIQVFHDLCVHQPS